jgi:ABC-type multidrug transport system fused ATPase/permease subunit
VTSSPAPPPSTALIITHRLATAVKADRILVLDEGRIVEDSVHATLLARGRHYAACGTSNRGSAATTSE